MPNRPPDPAIERGRLLYHVVRERRWREYDCAAARWAAPWWALTWLLTFGRQGRLPWEWVEREIGRPVKPARAPKGGTGEVVFRDCVAYKLEPEYPKIHDAVVRWSPSCAHTYWKRDARAHLLPAQSDYDDR